MNICQGKFIIYNFGGNYNLPIVFFFVSRASENGDTNLMSGVKSSSEVQRGA